MYLRREQRNYLIILANCKMWFEKYLKKGKLQLPSKTHNHGHINSVATAANDRKGPKHTGARIA